MSSVDRARALMRRVALGLPLLWPLAVPPLTMGGCPCPPAEQVHMHLVEAESAGAEQIDCRAVCPTGESPGGTTLDADMSGWLASGEADLATCAPHSERGVICVYLVQTCQGGGRRPRARWTARATPTDAQGDALLAMAAAEAASVVEFERLANELKAEGASSLAARARRAAADERRHTRLVTALATRSTGRAAVQVQVARHEPRALTSIAEDNAAEGLVREAYGALEAAVVARRAPDLQVRRVMRTIAVDEAQHALLSLDLHGWLARRISVPARRRVEAARVEAGARLRRELNERASPDPLGLPCARDAGRLLDALIG